MRHIEDQAGRVVASAELYDTGSSIIQFDIGPHFPSLVTLWLIEVRQLQGPAPRPFIVRARETSPWLEVTVGAPGSPDAREFAIWRATGDIYRVTDGEVGDDPMVTM